MTTFKAELAALVNEFEPMDRGFRLYGCAYLVPDEVPEHEVIQHREAMLQLQLYNLMHTKSRNSEDSEEPNAPPHMTEGVSRTFTARLAAANSSRYSWDPNWRIVSVSENKVALKKYGISAWTMVDHIHSCSKTLVEGAIVSARIPPEYRRLNFGYYTALGETPWPADRLDAPIRLYWSVTASGAPLLLQQLTRKLNAGRVPFVCKMLLDPAHYTRSDAAVVYIPRQQLDTALPIVETVYRSVSQWLRASTSAFVLRLAPGLGLAEQPDTRESFGEHMSRVLAQLMLGSSLLAQPGERLEDVLSGLRNCAIDPDRPYLREPQLGPACEDLERRFRHFAVHQLEI